MKIQPSTLPRCSRLRARINGQGTQWTSRLLWRRPERDRERRSWGLKTASLRHCRSSGSQDTECIARASSANAFNPSLLEGCWNPVWFGKINLECQKKIERAFLCVRLTLATDEASSLRPPVVLFSRFVFLSLSSLLPFYVWICFSSLGMVHLLMCFKKRLFESFEYNSTWLKR